MSVLVLMPALSPTMTEGTLASWLKKEGDLIESGDVLCEIETDKATMEVEAVEEGTLGKIIVAAGTEAVAVNSPIAIVLEEGDSAADIPSMLATKSAVTPGMVAHETVASVPSATPSSVQVANTLNKTRVFASPLARRIAEQGGVDISVLNGSGPNGRIVKQDVDAAIANGVSAIASLETSAKASSVAEKSGGYREIPNSTMRKVIASRLLESKQTVPHFCLTVDCQIDALLSMRKTMNAAASEGGKSYKISVNDFVVRAVAMALRRVPEANATWTESAIRFFNDVDVSVAVATSNGLITPVVRRADEKSLVSISDEIKGLAARGRDGKLLPEEYQGGSFTISNLGMFGVKDFVAIINPPQSCILAVGAGEQRPLVIDGSLAVATVMSCTLSVDHRSVDGAIGAKFLTAFKRLIEDPLTMIL